jgi:lipoate-protein ligase A
MMKTFRLIRSIPASAQYNMALDKSIFTRYLNDGIPVLRVYAWEAPSFTYGVSQHPETEIDLAACLLEGVQVAQRMTGGGVLFHHREITYSFVCSKDDIGEASDVFVSYRRSCAFLTHFYKSFGLKPSFAVESADFRDQSAAHQLCSASREKYDILLNGRKIGGNAQKRSRQAIFQHGSIPFEIDWDLARRFLPSLPAGISSLVTTLNQELSFCLTRETAEDKLINSFARVFGVNFMEEKECLLNEAGVA